MNPRFSGGARCPGVPHAPGALAVEVQDLFVLQEGRVVLQGVTFSVEVGGVLAVVGPNGAGKTTLLQVLAGILAPSSGEVRAFGHRPGRHLCLAYLPQRPQLDFRFPLTVADVVMMGRIGHLGLLRRPGAAERAKVEEALAVVGLAALARRPIADLSGGEQQRMFIARALAQEAGLLLLDEPLAGLDAPTQEGILALLGELAAHGITTLVAIHELGLAAAHFPLVLLLNRRRIGFGPPEAVFTPDRLKQAYGEGLKVVETPQGPMVLGDSGCPGGSAGGH